MQVPPACSGGLGGVLPHQGIQGALVQDHIEASVPKLHASWGEGCMVLGFRVQGLP